MAWRDEAIEAPPRMAKCVWSFQWWYPQIIQKLTISVYSLLKPTVLGIPFFGNPHMFSMKHLIIGVPRYPILTYTAHMRLWLAVWRTVPSIQSDGTNNAMRRTWGSYQRLEQLKLMKFQGGSSANWSRPAGPRLSSGPRYIKDRLTFLSGWWMCFSCGELAQYGISWWIKGKYSGNRSLDRNPGGSSKCSLQPVPGW